MYIYHLYCISIFQQGFSKVETPQSSIPAGDLPRRVEEPRSPVEINRSRARKMVIQLLKMLIQWDVNGTYPGEDRQKDDVNHGFHWKMIYKMVAVPHLFVCWRVFSMVLPAIVSSFSDP